MTRAKLLVLGLGLALIAFVATPAASAQDGATVTVEPATVEAAGDVEFTITGAGFTAAPPIAAIPCFDATTLEELTAAGIEACDTGALSLVNELSDGGFTLTVTYAVPEAGMCIAVADLAQTETAPPVCVAVGAAGGGEEGEGEGEVEPEPEPGDGEAGEDSGEEELANTGVESSLLAIIAIAVLGAGAMAVGYTRRYV